MPMSRIAAAALSALVGLGAITATAAPASADSAYFGFNFGDRRGNGVEFGYTQGYPRYAPYPPAYSYRPVNPPRWRPAVRPVQVCEPVWTTRRVEDRWGRVIKVVKVRRDECRLVYR